MGRANVGTFCFLKGLPIFSASLAPMGMWIERMKCEMDTWLLTISSFFSPTSRSVHDFVRPNVVEPLAALTHESAHAVLKRSLSMLTPAAANSYLVLHASDMGIKASQSCINLMC